MSVCLSVTIVSPAKTTEPIEMPFGIRTRCGSNEACIRWESHWRNLANDLELPVCGGDAMQATCQIISTTCFLSRSVRYRRSTLSIPVSFSAHVVQCCVGISARTHRLPNDADDRWHFENLAATMFTALDARLEFCSTGLD